MRLSSIIVDMVSPKVNPVLNGYDIKTIWAQWDMNGENLKNFVKFISPPYNLSEEEAAKRTWTGKRALEHGFTKVSNIRIFRHEGKNIHVLLYFEKP